jgi:hypothetical protein
MTQLILEIGQKPDDPGPRLRLGQVAAEGGMTPLAVQSYQAALAVAPDCDQARKGLRELGVPEPKIPPAPSNKLAGSAANGAPNRVP